jgi:translation initiation factor 2D
MAVSSDQLAEDGKEKGKAVIVLHTWKDHLWEMGSKLDPPEDVPIQIGNADAGQSEQSTEENGDDGQPAEITKAMDNLTTQDGPSQEVPTASAPQSFKYTPEEVTDLLHKSFAGTCNDAIESTDVRFPNPIHNIQHLPYLTCASQLSVACRFS